MKSLSKHMEMLAMRSYLSVRWSVFFSVFYDRGSKDNIKMDVKFMESIYLAHDSVLWYFFLNMAMCLNGP